MVKVLFPAMIDKRRTMRRTLGVVGIGSLLLVAIPLSASEWSSDPTPQPTKQQGAALGHTTQGVDEPLDIDKTQPPAGDTSSISVEMTSQSDEQPKVDVTVNGVTNLIGLQYSINFDSTVLTFVRATNCITSLPGLTTDVVSGTN